MRAPNCLACAATLLLGLCLPPLAQAEMSSVTVAGSVRAFDEKTVTLQINRQRIKIPRGLLAQQNLKAGDAVLVTFKGEQINYLLSVGLSGVGKNGEMDSRGPASEKRKPR